MASGFEWHRRRVSGSREGKGSSFVVEYRADDTIAGTPNPPVRFYDPSAAPYGCLSNFSRDRIELDGRSWPTVEHYYQAQKFVGQPIAEAIRRARSPMAAKMLAHHAAVPVRSDWEQVRDDVMRVAVRQKLVTHAAVLATLLATGDAVLIEDSATDGYWGRGPDGGGLNRLGQILMEMRSALRREAE
jgi:ribA/ribD-fused uncharacterized protein